MLPPNGFLSALNYYKAGFVEWKFALIIAITFIIGGYVGSKFAIRISPSILKKVFGTLLFIAAIRIIFSR